MHECCRIIIFLCVNLDIYTMQCQYLWYQTYMYKKNINKNKCWSISRKIKILPLPNDDIFLNSFIILENAKLLIPLNQKNTLNIIINYWINQLKITLIFTSTYNDELYYDALEVFLSFSIKRGDINYM